MEGAKFYSVLAHLNDFYGITMKEADFENIALHAWDLIGNKNTRVYSYRTEIVDHYIDLPCNVEIIESVTRDIEDVESTGGFDAETTETKNIIWEDNISTHRLSTEPLFHRGGYIDYQREGNRLLFKSSGIYVNVIYKGILADEEGLPFLNHKEIDAIAKYCAFIQLQKQAMVTKDQATFQIATMMQQQWQRACDSARVSIRMNQNDMDNVLNVLTSWDRKRFGISYKPIR